MNLNDLAPKLNSKKLSEHYTSQFGKKVDVSQVSHDAAVQMLSETRKKIAEFKSSREGHYRETNTNYLKLMFMEQALSAKVAESQPESKVKVMNSKAKYMNAVKTVAVGGKLTESELQALGVSKNLLSVLESRASAIKFMSKMVEARKCKSKKKMMEGTEVDAAQVVLAAQDMVDQVQKMIENMTDLKVKELPALVDGIKGEQGVDAASQFQSTVDSALQGLIDALGGAKGELESAVGVITGEEMSVPGEEMPMGDMDMDAELPAAPEMDMEPEMPEEEPGDELSNLGRERI